MGLEPPQNSVCNARRQGVGWASQLGRPRAPSCEGAISSTLRHPPKATRGLEHLQDSIRSAHAPGLNMPDYLHHSQYVTIPNAMKEMIQILYHMRVYCGPSCH